MTPPHKTRRWAVTQYTHSDPRIPAILGTYWTRHGANNARRHLGDMFDWSRFRVTPMDRAPYRARATAITGQLHHGPLSVAGLALRTTMTAPVITDTLIRMARNRRVVHRYTGDDDAPDRGVWRALTAQERASGARTG